MADTEKEMEKPGKAQAKPGRILLCIICPVLICAILAFGFCFLRTEKSASIAYGETMKIERKEASADKASKQEPLMPSRDETKEARSRALQSLQKAEENAEN